VFYHVSARALRSCHAEFSPQYRLTASITTSRSRTLLSRNTSVIRCSSSVWVVAGQRGQRDEQITQIPVTIEGCHHLIADRVQLDCSLYRGVKFRCPRAGGPNAFLYRRHVLLVGHVAFRSVPRAFSRPSRRFLTGSLLGGATTISLRSR
jgi:hypothetical protein